MRTIIILDFQSYCYHQNIEQPLLNEMPIPAGAAFVFVNTTVVFFFSCKLSFCYAKEILFNSFPIRFPNVMK